MVEVVFYTHIVDKFSTACRLTAKARLQGLRVLISLENRAQAESFDRLLWTASALSFVPHCLSGHELAAETPVCIRHAPTDDAADVLINLANDAPEDFERFARLVEFAGVEEDERAAARARWRYYKERGCELRNHRLEDQ